MSAREQVLTSLSAADVTGRFHHRSKAAAMTPKAVRPLVNGAHLKWP